MKRLAFSCGDINGIGPEITIKTFNRISFKNFQAVFTVPLNVFEEVSSFIEPKFSFTICDNLYKIKSVESNVIIIPLEEAEIYRGRPTALSGETSKLSIDKSLEIIDHKLAEGIITAPISKQAIDFAGYNFPGHTEYLADHYSIEKFLMIFLSNELFASLLTIHEPISKVPSLITEERIESSIKILIETLAKDFNINNPKIAVLGLNPHAGEMGRIGTEEIDYIIPVIKKYKKYIDGPFVPDAFFAQRNYKKYDSVLGMYHDQILIPFKMIAFASGVNFTAGLPIVRTSPDHGTAFDIAYKGIADESSLLSAYYWADRITNFRKRINE